MEDANVDSGLAPVIRGEITRLRSALQNGTLEENLNNIDAVIKLGHDARPLVLQVLAAFSRGEHWVSCSALVQLLEATQDQSILKTLRGSDRLPKLGIHEKVVCFRRGAHELEDDLVRYLYQHRHSPGTPARPEVVDVLGESGGSKSLAVMKTLRSELSELYAPVSSIIADFEQQAQLQLRDKVHRALQCLRERGVDQQTQ